MVNVLLDAISQDVHQRVPSESSRVSEPQPDLY